MFIAAFSVVRRDSYLLKLGGDQAKQAVRKMGRDFNVMASCLTLAGNRLVLRNLTQLYQNDERQESTFDTEEEGGPPAAANIEISDYFFQNRSQSKKH